MMDELLKIVDILCGQMFGGRALILIGGISPRYLKSSFINEGIEQCEYRRKYTVVFLSRSNEFFLLADQSIVDLCL